MEASLAKDVSGNDEEQVDSPVQREEQEMIARVFGKEIQRLAGDTISLVTTRAEPKYTLDRILQYLQGDLRQNAVAVSTVRMLVNAYGNQKSMIGLVVSISHIHAARDTPGPYVAIDNYMLSPFIGEFGYNEEAFAVDRSYLDRSLWRAVSFECRDDEDSLDTVFRQTLKVLSDEIFDIKVTGEKPSMDNPMYVSAQYLELRLLQKIREHYKSLKGGEDILVYLQSPDHLSPFHDHVVGCKCEQYLKTLIDRYNLRPETFDETLKNVAFIPARMRVWTSVENQLAVNREITNHLKLVYENKSLSEDVEEMIRLYREAMYTYFRRNEEFLSEICNASELFAWMAFGVLSDEVERGTMHMAVCYNLLLVRQRKNKVMYWNYPLASLYEPNPPFCNSSS